MYSHNLFMQLALDFAWRYQTLALPNPTVGALVVLNGQILSLQAHKKAGTPHAEVLALRDALKQILNLDKKECKRIDALDAYELHEFILKHKESLCEISLYVTLEPCSKDGKTPSCARLLEQIAPKEIVFGAFDSTQNSGGKEILKASKINVISGVLQKECEILIEPFLAMQKKGSFNLFKLALRLNGDYSGKISKQESQQFTHNQRSIAQNIIISGATLRCDDPMLDSRLAKPPYEVRSPDVGIITQKKLNLENFRIHKMQRKITLNPTSFIGFSIFEGGFGLLDFMSDKLDWALFHLSPSISVHRAKEAKFTRALDFSLLKVTGEQDALMWMRCKK